MTKLMKKSQLKTSLFRNVFVLNNGKRQNVEFLLLPKFVWNCVFIITEKMSREKKQWVFAKCYFLFVGIYIKETFCSFSKEIMKSLLFIRTGIRKRKKIAKIQKLLSTSIKRCYQKIKCFYPGTSADILRTACLGHSFLLFLAGRLWREETTKSKTWPPKFKWILWLLSPLEINETTIVKFTTHNQPCF